MGSQGNSYAYSACFAENEERSPWTPFHVQHGFDAQTSAVSLFFGGWYTQFGTIRDDTWEDRFRVQLRASDPFSGGGGRRARPERKCREDDSCWVQRHSGQVKGQRDGGSSSYVPRSGRATSSPDARRIAATYSGTVARVISTAPPESGA